MHVRNAAWTIVCCRSLSIELTYEMEMKLGEIDCVYVCILAEERIQGYNARIVTDQTILSMINCLDEYIH